MNLAIAISEYARTETSIDGSVGAVSALGLGINGVALDAPTPFRCALIIIVGFNTETDPDVELDMSIEVLAPEQQPYLISAGKIRRGKRSSTMIITHETSAVLKTNGEYEFRVTCGETDASCWLRVGKDENDG